MAGQIAELSRQSLRGDFRAIDPASARVLLLDGAPRILGAFDERLAGHAAGELRRLGIEIRTGTTVTGVDAESVTIRDDDGKQDRIATMTKVWSAGVQASPLGRRLAEQSGAPVTKAGRVGVLPDCTLPGHPEVFVVGDMMDLDDLPGLAEVAMQSGMHAASQIRRRLDGDRTPRRFRYVDLGSLAAISRYYAIGQRGPVRIWGKPGWLIWLLVHLTFLTGFKSRVGALASWSVTFFGRSRSERAVSLRQLAERAVRVGAK